MVFASPTSEGSDSVVEKEALRSTRDVSNVMSTVVGWVILTGRCATIVATAERKVQWEYEPNLREEKVTEGFVDTTLQP